MDVNILLFHNFETLDAFGPVEILGCVGEYRLRFLSADGGLIQSKQGARILTQPVKDADDSGIVLVPGGQGTRLLVNDLDFIKALKQIAVKSAYCLTVCTGSALLAKTGLLNGRKATSNKKAFRWVESLNSDVRWLSHARWTSDGKFYTSSGVSAGMDMSLCFLADRFGPGLSRSIATSMEYVWNADKNDDPFAPPQ